MGAEGCSAYQRREGEAVVIPSGYFIPFATCFTCSNLSSLSWLGQPWPFCPCERCPNTQRCKDDWQGCGHCPPPEVYTVHVEIDTGERFEWDIPVDSTVDKQIRDILRKGVVCEVEGDVWHTRCYPTHRIHQINVSKPRPHSRPTLRCYMARAADNGN